MGVNTAIDGGAEDGAGVVLRVRRRRLLGEPATLRTAAGANLWTVHLAAQRPGGRERRGGKASNESTREKVNVHTHTHSHTHTLSLSLYAAVPPSTHDGGQTRQSRLEDGMPGYLGHGVRVAACKIASLAPGPFVAPARSRPLLGSRLLGCRSKVTFGCWVGSLAGAASGQWVWYDWQARSGRRTLLTSSSKGLGQAARCRWGPFDTV